MAVSDHCVCQVTEVVIHPRYVEASSSGFDIAVYKVGPVIASASKKSIRRFVITEKAPTRARAFSWLKAANQTARPLWPLRRGPNFTLRDRGVNARLA